MVEILPAMHISAPWLTSGGITLTNLKVVNDVHFMKVIKTDASIHRLLLGCSRATKNMLTSTSIVDDVIELKNAMRLKLLKSYCEEATADDDLGVNVTNLEDKACLLPPFVVIMAPTVNEVEGIPIKCLPNQRCQPLWCEVSPDVIAYLHKVAVHQASTDDTCFPKIQRKLPGPWFDSSRRSWRVKYYPGGASKPKTKDFKVTGESDSEKAAALDLANQFFQNSA
jgi:hypothetical protein